MTTRKRRWLRRGNGGGRLESLGHDYQAGHLAYVSRAGPGGLRWLRTKPFSAPPSYELARCLHSFSHIVERLGLGLRAQVLDVGCGPGWLSEFLARSGYSVTGVDISLDMVELARERIARIEGEVGEGIEPTAEFHALAVRELPWRDRFDAAILYDTMHHFDDELETLRAIRRALAPGGRMYLHEGARPEPGSPGERRLIDEMREYGTLESPFDPEYLLESVQRAGFVDVRRFVEVDELVELSHSDEALQRLKGRLERPDTNTFLATNPIPLEPGTADAFTARLEAAGAWRTSPDGASIAITVWLTNTGLGFWPAVPSFPFPRGAVTIAPYTLGSDGERAPLSRTGLPRSVSPGESIAAEVRVPRAEAAGQEELWIDLVREGVGWFSELGTEPILVPLPRE